MRNSSSVNDIWEGSTWYTSALTSIPGVVTVVVTVSPSNVQYTVYVVPNSGKSTSKVPGDVSTALSVVTTPLDAYTVEPSSVCTVKWGKYPGIGGG